MAQRFAPEGREMKLRITAHEFGPQFSCIDDNEYDGAPDAGPQLVGQGDTEEAARKNFMEQWIERECARDLKNAVEFGKSWDAMLSALFGVKS